MNRNEAAALLKTMPPDFLPKSGMISGQQSYICPECENGSGDSKTGITLDPHDGAHYHCFRCGLHEDIIGLWMKQQGIPRREYPRAVAELCGVYGIPLDDEEEQSRQFEKSRPLDMETLQPIVVQPVPQQAVTEQIQLELPEAQPAAQEGAGEEKRRLREQNRSYYRQCADRVSETDYWRQRGISDELVKKYLLGYESNFFDKATGQHWKAVVVPVSADYYAVRNTDPNAAHKNRWRKTKLDGSAAEPFNWRAIWDSEEPVFVCEGPMDALAVMEAGGIAIALIGTAHRRLLELCRKRKPTQPLLLSLDNDEEGQKNEEKLAEGLEQLGVTCYRVKLTGDCKDCGDALLKDPEALTEAVRKAKQEADPAYREQLDYQNSFVYAHAQDFVNGVSASANTPAISTGFPLLDKVLEGGFTKGFYVVGAISSLGKTAFSMQIADQIAAAGTDVLAFSQEMDLYDLMARSISRTLYQDYLREGFNRMYCKTERAITQGSRWEEYSQEQKRLIYRAIEEYTEGAGRHLRILEGRRTAQNVADEVKKHIRITGNVPFVVLDYLQILKPADLRGTDKMNLDASLDVLMELVNTYRVPLLCVSSINRMSYSQPVSLEIFKESGSVEYDADTCFGLQMKGAGTKSFNVDAAKDKTPREVELIVLKNRHGPTGKKLLYEYNQLFNYFDEIEIEGK